MFSMRQFESSVAEVVPIAKIGRLIHEEWLNLFVLASEPACQAVVDSGGLLQFR